MSIIETIEKADKNQVKERLRVPFLFALVLLPVVVSLSLDLPLLLKAITSTKWPEAPGVVRRGELSAMKLGRDPAWRPIVVYSYTVNGKEYLNDVIKFQPDLGLPGYEATQLKERYASSTPIQVRYDPQNPDDSCIEPSPNYFAVFTHFIMFALISVLLYLSAYPPVAPE